MTDKHSKTDSDSLNASDGQGAESVETLLSKLTLDQTASSSHHDMASADSDVAPSKPADSGDATGDSSTPSTSSVQPPAESNKQTKEEPRVERDQGSVGSRGAEEQEEELSPKDAALKKLGLKATHRSGFYLYEDNPQRLRIQTSTHAFDLDRRCPHAKADMLKWGVLRQNNTLVCGVHYWRFNLEDEGKCIAHPEESLHACPVERSIDW